MRGILHIKVTSLTVVVAPRTSKIIRNRLNVFEGGENLLQNGVFHFVFRLSQSPEIALQRWNLRRRKTDFSKKGLAFKALINQ